MSTHSDAVLLSRVCQAIASWQASAEAGVTSSITGGGAIAALERAFSDRLEGRFTIALPSGTAALRVALESVGVDRGNEVICSVYDWPAASAAIRSLGARPVFADIDETTTTIDPEDAAARITRRTRAVVATHLFGIPADVPSLVHLLQGSGIPVVEDCAQALGATIDERPVGALGAAAAFSLGPGKTIDAGEAGLVAFQSREHHLAALQASQHPVRQLIAGVPTPRLDGLELRIHPLAAIVALHAWAHLPAQLATQRHHAHVVHSYLRRLRAMPLGIDHRRQPSWYEVPFLMGYESRSKSTPLTVHRAQANVIDPADTPRAAAIADRVYVALLTATTEGGALPNKQTPSNPNDQRARQAKARKEAQQQRGSKKFAGKSNPHIGGSRGQSGQPSR